MWHFSESGGAVATVFFHCLKEYGYGETQVLVLVSICSCFMSGTYFWPTLILCFAPVWCQRNSIEECSHSPPLHHQTTNPIHQLGANPLANIPANVPRQTLPLLRTQGPRLQAGVVLQVLPLVLPGPSCLARIRPEKSGQREGSSPVPVPSRALLPFTLLGRVPLLK